DFLDGDQVAMFEPAGLLDGANFQPVGLAGGREEFQGVPLAGGGFGLPDFADLAGAAALLEGISFEALADLELRMGRDAHTVPLRCGISLPCQVQVPTNCCTGPRAGR